ncbi:MAG: SDR family oxidoreductase [Rhodospirillaceae bacterium]|jgi:glucose 1-dehydrogenase|nr:SDR family oxidoreductase [Rhodospirillaceae bacterium]MBT5245595.1 SDR family oxidoreductase [Rhodospirillaceae bacterium]MBT5561157.1 SDR family oxidoreductase [Rhodospirillaceae bacterium]MBT6242852.1 SDR family oxidoreductase [Rhodospirillaceae bacterium]MBT7138400.1 SDR family oxidoreductase [Rhodospirillaceae bacterium]
MRLEDKTAIITGSAGGIGLACARAFAHEGARVVISDINDDLGEAAAASIREGGGQAHYLHCDVSDKSQVDQLIAGTLEHFGGLDIMLSNAAVLFTGDFLDISEDELDQTLSINLKGFFLTGQAAARHMAENGGGVVINMSSINAVTAIPKASPYVICKGGVNQLTKVMALSLADKGIRVNAIGPGTILTDMAKKVMADEAARKMILSRTPMGRCGEPEEMASVAVFLASDESSYITGQTIYADGGRLALGYTVPVEE